MSTASSGMTRLRNRLWMNWMEPKSLKRQRQLNQYWMNQLHQGKLFTPVGLEDDSFPSDLDDG